MKIVDFINALYKKNIILKENAGKLQIQAPNGSVTSDILLEIKQKKSELINYLASTKVDSSMLIGRAKTELKTISYTQRRLWLLDQIDGSSAHYNMPAALRLSGKLNTEALHHAFTTILERHESLRTCFVLGDNGQPLPVVQTGAPFVVSAIDLSELEERERERQLAQHICDEANRVFDLSSDLMLRVQLIKVAVDEHVVSVTMHHIASDAWSITILINEFTALYSAYVQGQENPLPPLTIQYADYAHWQRNWLQGEVLDLQLSYWTAHLAGLPAVHSLPLDHPRPSMKTFIGKTYSSQIAATTSHALTTLCHTQGATLFMGLHAAFSVLLSRYSNETDIVVGSPIANREQAAIAPLIGFFVNTLVLRSDLSGNPSFTSLLNQSKGMLLDAYAHQQVPFEQIVERLQPERSLSHTPLFQIMLVLQNNEQGELKLPGLTLSPVGQSGAGIAKFDLTLNISESARGLQLGWEYNTDLFDQETIARMANHFELLLGALVATPDENVFNVEMLSASERHQLLVEWNNTTVDYPKDKCIHELFEAQVENNPDAVAVIFESEQLTYGELNQKANQLAHYLINEKQVKPDTLVGICIERSLEMVVGILGILKAGGAYVPLDPDYPEARLKYMLEDAQLTTVITQRHLRETTPVTDAQAVCLDDESIQQILQTQFIQNPSTIDIGLTSRHLAYVIYTSGSTGNPKGVIVEHSGLCNLTCAQQQGFGVDASSRVLQFASIAFDAAISEVSVTLCVGAQLILMPNLNVKNALLLESQVVSAKITHATLPPALLSSLNIYEWRGLNALVIAGDVCNIQLADQWAAQCNLINAYGPSEVTVCATMGSYQSGQMCLHIGKPLQNIQVYILNDSNDLVIRGVKGELHIGGVGLARGYLNRPDLTAEKFIPNPFYDKTNPSSSERLYKTGDLVRWLPDGNLEFLGRIDHQVKIRGFRIELGEIENTLSTHADVKDAIVLAKESAATGDKRLVAYVVTDAFDLQGDDESVTAARHELIESLRHHLGQTLPDYMIPAVFVLLEKLPLTPNGKVDRKALPEPDLSAQQNTYIAPRTEMERVLCEIWQEVLGVERVGITDNFFALGGHSLLIMQVISRLQQRGLSMTARQLFSAPHLVDLADALNNAATTLISAFKAPANLIPDLCEQITPEMLPLVTLTAEDIVRVVGRVPGGARNVQDIYPLAPLQEGILFHHMMSTQGDPYVMPLLFKVKGAQRVANFIAALQFVIDRHDVLRTAIFWQELSVPVQVVCRQASVPVTWLVLDGTQDIEADMRARCAPEKQAMDLGQAPLIGLQIAADPNLDQHFVLLQLHHMISDHVGLEIVQKELAIYGAGQADSLVVPVPYREFVAHAQYQALHHNAGAFFTEVLGDIEESTAPFNVLDVAGDGSRIVEVRGSIPDDIAIQIRQLSKTFQVTPAVLFHAAWAMVVAGCSGRDDVVFGTVLSGRLQGTVGAENMLGVFINTLPLRVKLSHVDATGLVRQVQESLRNLLPYEQASLALAQRCSGVSGGAPLFTAVLNYRHSAVVENTNAEIANKTDTDTGFEFISGQERTNYPFGLSVDDFGEGFALDVQVDSSVSVDRILGYMQTAIAGLVRALDVGSRESVYQISILPDAERHQLLVEWNNTTVDYPKDKCIHELFEAQVENNPDAVAVIFENEQLTYGELNQKANQLAHYLINEKQVKPDTLVGICIERSLEMVVGILGILKAGGAYVPLDPDYPEARLKYMLEDAQLTTVITQCHLRETTPLTDAQAVCLDDESIQQILQTQSIQNPSTIDTGLTSRHLAYVIYTSGSTGNPKGVEVIHTGVVNYLNYIGRVYFTNINGSIVSSPLAFDATVTSLLGPLFVGKWLHIIKQDGHELAHLAELLACLTTAALFKITPAHMEGLSHFLQNKILQNLPHWLIVGGDQLTTKIAKQWKKQFFPLSILVNEYGPTETVVGCSTYIICNDEQLNHSGVAVAIGKPIDNTQLLILDSQLNTVPVSIEGELHIGGVGLARGYLNRPDLTAEKFIANPFYDKSNPASSERLYKTGDLVRWLPDGNLEFLGRIDHQVKIRGFRIELGEIENTLSTHADVKDAIVLAKESATTGDKRLVAYVVTGAVGLQDDSETAIAACHDLIETLRQHLNQTLPDYMVPSAFVLLSQLPLTPNGKVDRKALPEPDMSALQATYIAPRTETEEMLCEIWQEVLGVERVGITDNFFQLGGHSLSATRLISRINQRFNVALPLKTLFSSQTLESLVQSLLLLDTDVARPALVGISRDQTLLPSFAQQRLWLLDQIDGGSAHYNMPSALKLTGMLNIDALNQALTSIIERHESLRTNFAVNEEGQPLQVIQPAAAFLATLTDLSALDAGECELQLPHVVAEEASRVFDLSADVMLRAQLLKIAADEHILLVTMHHIASDGWSMAILINEFSALYGAYTQGHANPLTPLSIQYADYAHWQRNWLQGEVLDQQLDYWTKQLASLPVVHSLPLDHTRPTIQSFVGKTYHSQIDAGTSHTLNSLCQAQGATVFMGLHAAFSTLLSRYSNETDIVVGSPIANREQAEVAGLIGFFVNTLILRSDLSENPSFTALLNQSKTMLLDAYTHQQVPFEQIVERLQPERSLSHSALFQVMLVLQNNEAGTLELPGLTLSPVVQSGAEMAKYDLTLYIAESAEGFQLNWEYNTDLFEATTIARMAGHFELLLKALLATPDANVFTVNMLSVQERNQLLVEWNDTAVEYPQDKCIHELFETQVENNPNAIAVIFEEQQIVSDDLNRKANQLAHYLINEKGVKPDTLVGICVERSVEMVVGILAILKAGGAYVPLDPEYPEARLKYMLDDANLTTVLTQSHLRETTPVSDVQAVYLDSENIQQQLQQQSIQNPNPRQLGLTSSHLAYAIYTSGSTGNPKGVLVPHRSIFNRVSWMQRQFPALVDDVFCQKTAAGFVDHVAEIFQALAYGKRLVIVRTDDTLNADHFIRLVAQHKITRLTLVPSLLKFLIQQGTLTAMPSLRLVISSGEALQLEETRSFYRALPATRLLNLYGSSEIGADVSAYLIEAFDENLEVMQYFLDPVPTSSSTQSALRKFTYQSPPSITDNLIFRAQYSDSSLPQRAVEYQTYIDELSESVLPFSVDVGAQRFIGHMTSKLPNFIPELSRLITQLNQNMVKVETSNNLTLIERQVLAIMHRLFFQLPTKFYDTYCQDPLHVFGMVTGGGSVANLTALWCARNRGLLALGVSQADIIRFGAHSLLQQNNFKGAVILGTRLMHYSMRKSAAVMGLGEAGIMYVEQDAAQKMSIVDLQRCIEYCQQHQIFIIAIVGIAGATETGTVDPLDKIAVIAHQNQIHFHVDAAWGGAFQLSQHYRHLLSGIELADSITFCPHKQLYLSQGISLCLLRDTQSAASIATHANYQSQKGSYDLGQYSVEGSRPAHALLLHASLNLLGQNGYSWLIEQGMSKTRYFTLMVEKSTCFELVGYPDLNIITYRYVPVALRSKSNYSPADHAQMSEIVVKIQQRQFALGASFVSKTTIQLASSNGELITVFRIVLSNPLTQFDDLREVLVDQLCIANELIEAPSNHHLNQLSGLSVEKVNSYAKWQVPIGKPIACTQLVILNSNNNLIPSGVYGELHVGGSGLARGYLNRPDLTAEKFITNPFYDKNNPSSSERLYKTGDLVRWLPDGNLEFLGRIDHQVKIRGFRIELGEIENTLSAHAAANNAVVLAKESADIGDKRLVAYVATDAVDLQDDSETAIAARHDLIETLRQHLNQTLPDYMVPSAFVLLAQLPLTPNGKVDRKALPEPDMSALQAAYVAPRTEVERQLCEIWQEVLGVDRVGITDNFFQLGGDSLKAMRFIASAKKRAIFYVLRQLFENNTIESLSKESKSNSLQSINQSLIVGNVPLSSAQQWFLNTILVKPNRGTISSIKEVEDFNVEIFKKSLSKVLEHHDALRAKFIRNHKGWTQIIVSPEVIDVAIETYDISNLTTNKQMVFINDYNVKKIQEGIDISLSPLIRVDAFNRGKNRFVVRFEIHHLLVDGYSASVMLEDLEQCYMALSIGNAYTLPQKTISMAEWQNTLTTYVTSSQMSREIKYWQNLPWNKIKPIPTDFLLISDKYSLGSFVDLECRLTKDQTSNLIHAASSLLEIPVIDIIIAAVVHALMNYQGNVYQLIKVVDSGRDLGLDVDLSRTVGWIAISRILLLSCDMDTPSAISAAQIIHNQIKNIPRKGLGFELLKCYHSDQAVKESMGALPKPEILLNYLGASTSDAHQSPFMSAYAEQEKKLPQFDPDNTTHEKLIFTALIFNGELIMRWQYNKNLYRKETILSLTNQIIKYLRF